ncbi:uncharacterized protein LOC129910301 [Episyrphus balteatus]|uniref:uncharacterized protein LOC129910301 n=1 Tax=Episyrphus balteatus TaxID=286459 RepID=UPI002485F207|nr:uncharacterized protein LOC129910301 [Episyrphus balteatus]
MKVLKYAGNTSNLYDHLRRRHTGFLPNTASDSQVEAIENERPSSSGSNNASSINASLNTINRNTIATPQRTDSSDGTVQPRKKCLQTKLVLEDKRLATTINNQGFLEYSKKMQPLYHVPNRKLLSNTMIQEKFDEVVRKHKTMFQTISNAAVTTDMWASDSNRAFLSVTCHFIFKNKIYSAVLETKEVPERHTAENIGNILMNILQEWCILTKVVTIVSDNGANIKKTICDVLKKPHHPCIAHTLNLCVTDAIKNNLDISLMLLK